MPTAKKTEPVPTAPYVPPTQKVWQAEFVADAVEALSELEDLKKFLEEHIKLSSVRARLSLNKEEGAV